MTSQTEENKRLAIAWFQAMSQRGVAAVESLADPGCRFFIAG